MKEEAESKERLTVTLVESIEDLTRHGEKYDRLQNFVGGRLFPVYDRLWTELTKSIYRKSNVILFFLLAYRAENLIGVAPFQLESRSLIFGQLNKLSFWGQNCGSTMFENMTGEFLIANDGDRYPCMVAFVRFLEKEVANRWDLLELRMLCDNSKNLQIFRECFKPEGQFRSSAPSYFVDLSGGWESFLASLSGKTRQNYRRGMKKLVNRGSEHEFACYECVSETLIADLAALHTKRQQELQDSGRSRDAVLGNPDHRQIITRLFQALAKQGRLRIYCLSIGGTLAAFSTILARGEEAVSWFGAFDSRFHDCSPWVLVHAYSLESEATRFGVRFINLLPGTTTAKQEWSTIACDNWSYVTTNKKSRAARVKLIFYSAARRIKSILRRLVMGRVIFL